jgi:ADP-ribose pyrophosphatase YjhB (NUDIX family)
MRYCSECGHPIARRQVPGDDRERYVCEACGVVHYQNPRIIVCCVAHWRDEVLVCRRACPPARGQWALPSGYLECGETLEAAAARETLEETGLKLDPARLELYAVMSMTQIEQVAVTFRAEVDTKPSLQAGSECLEVAFLSEAQMLQKDVAWRDSFANRGEQFFRELRTGKFTIQLATLGCHEAGTKFRLREYSLKAPCASTEGS